jgi:uncharacterized protein
MSLQEKIKIDLKQSMINKDTERKDLLRVVIGEFSRTDHYNKISKELPDDVVTGVITKLVKNAKEMGNEGEIKILSEYLPTILGEKQLETLISGIINKNSYSTMKDMGKVMGELRSKYGSTYDGKMASVLVKKLLS